MAAKKIKITNESLNAKPCGINSTDILLREYVNSGYGTTEEKQEEVQKVHIQLRELFAELFAKWCEDFRKRAVLTTNFEEFISLNLSLCGIVYKEQSNLFFPFREHGLSLHFMNGYECAVKGEDPFMDEIRVFGRGSKPEMISQDLMDYMNGYYHSMQDHFVMNFEKEQIGKISNTKRRNIVDGQPLPQSLKDIFINEDSYIECMNALAIVKYPVISEDNRYLLGPKQKGAFTAWFDVLKLRQKFAIVPTNAQLAKLLNIEITGLNIGEDGTTLGRPGTTYYNKYYNPLSKLII